MNTRNKKSIALFIFTACFLVRVFSQTPSIIQKIRFPLWALLDAYPGLEEAQDVTAAQYDYPVKAIREVAPFLISGMVYGWEFTYTPSDKLRGVEEYIEIKEIVDFSLASRLITYSSPWIQDNRLNCWCEFTRTAHKIQNYNLWASIKNPVTHGRGNGSLTEGFEGIRTAATEAVKDSVRNYYRSVIKNKPKEIRGKVLIRDIPSIGIVSGQYIINLDFFLECGKILEYSVF